MKRFAAITLLATGLALSACRDVGPTVVCGTGTIHPSQVECSAWFVRDDAGHEYQLTSLAAEFQSDGLRVRFGLHVRSDVASTCMVGQVADVVSMRRL
jgi:hypothetical protein